MSSETEAGAPPSGPRIATYAFEQLEPTPAGPAGGVADVLSAAWAEAEQVRAQARLTGEAEGRAAGLAAARAENEPALAALAAAVDAVEASRAELVAKLERDAVDLALRLAEQVVAGALAVQPERVVDVARNALRRIADRRRVTLVVNPADLELVQGAVGEVCAALGGIEQCDVQAARRIARGSAVARTDEGEIDATIDTQLARAREVVAAALGGDGDDGS